MLLQFFTYIEFAYPKLFFNRVRTFFENFFAMSIINSWWNICISEIGRNYNRMVVSQSLADIVYVVA